MVLCTSAHVGLGPSSLPLQQQPTSKCFRRLLVLRAATDRSHQHSLRLLYRTGHFEPRSVDQSRHGQAQHARLPSSLLLLPAHRRGATSTAAFATGYTPRSVGPARRLDTLLPSFLCGCAPLLRHPRVP